MTDSKKTESENQIIVTQRESQREVHFHRPKRFSMANHLADKSWLASAASRSLITSRRFEDSYATTLVCHDDGASATATEAVEGHVIVAIDIGTAFSGYAFSFSGDRYNIYAMRQTDRCRPLESGPSPCKVPTCLLLKPNGAFHSFGGEAMEYYNRELNGREQKEWWFFERFKMSLHSERVSLRVHSRHMTSRLDPSRRCLARRRSPRRTDAPCRSQPSSRTPYVSSAMPLFAITARQPNRRSASRTSSGSSPFRRFGTTRRSR